MWCERPLFQRTVIGSTHCINMPQEYEGQRRLTTQKGIGILPPIEIIFDRIKPGDSIKGMKVTRAKEIQHSLNRLNLTLSRANATNCRQLLSVGSYKVKPIMCAHE